MRSGANAPLLTNKDSMHVNAYIFDFDGLILDTETVEYELWRRQLAEYGVDLTIETWGQCVGASFAAFHPMDYLETQLGHRLPERQDIIERSRTIAQQATNQTDALPGVTDFIVDAYAAGVRLAVASSSPRSWVVGHLKRLDLFRYFPVVCTSENVARLKPAPDLFLLAAQRLGVQPAECVVFEDSHNGIAAAKAAGMFCITVPNVITSHMDLSAADMQSHSFTAIPFAQLHAALNK